MQQKKLRKAIIESILHNFILHTFATSVMFFYFFGVNLKLARRIPVFSC